MGCLLSLCMDQIRHEESCLVHIQLVVSSICRGNRVSVVGLSLVLVVVSVVIAMVVKCEV